MSKAHQPSEATFLELRRQLFQKSEELSESTETKQTTQVLGVVLETPANSGCSIVYALADGSAGVFPGLAHVIDHPSSEPARARARSVCRLAEAVHVGLAGTSESPEPPSALVVADYVRVIDQQEYRGTSSRGGHQMQAAMALESAPEAAECVQLSVMRSSGIVHARGEDLALVEADDPLGQLYRAMLELSSAIEDPSSPAAGMQGGIAGSEHADYQTPGEASPRSLSAADLSQDFANRLLACLAAGSFTQHEQPAVVLSSDAPLPQLERFVADGPQREWLQTHPLAIESIRSDDVIDRVLKDARRRLFSRRFELHHVVATEAGPIAADFDLRLTENRTGTRTLEISPSQR